MLIMGVTITFAKLWGRPFGAPVERQQVVVVGSAKLGFSISEKRTFGGVGLERYRPFRPESDIDIALVHPFIFDQLWRELSDHSHRSPTMPRDSARLGDYLVYGWIRPDHFPKNVRLRRCDDWWDTFNKMTAGAHMVFVTAGMGGGHRNWRLSGGGAGRARTRHPHGRGGH
jgi:hypothetical protein